MNIHEHGVPHSANEIVRNISSSVMTLHWEENWSPFSCSLVIKCGSNKYIDWFYITWNAYHISKFRLPAIPSTFKSVLLLNYCSFWLFVMEGRKNGNDAAEYLHNFTSVTSTVTMFRTIGYRPEVQKQWFHWLIDRSIWDDPQRDVIRSKRRSE